MEHALGEHWANPSSVHRPGQAARHEVELSRASIAELLGLEPGHAKQITFTSGGTESIAMGVLGVLRARASAAPSRPTIVTTAVEHAAMRDLAEDLEKTGQVDVARVPVDPNGVVVLDALDQALDHARMGASLCVIQWANNETGVIQPIEAIGARCRQRGVAFLCDGTQWIGKEPVAWSSASPQGPPYDLLVGSAHKFHGPKGVGFLWSRAGVRFRPMLQGSQELGKRGGTENVPGIVGAGQAARETIDWLENPSLREQGRLLRDRFERGILHAIPEARVNGQIPESNGAIPPRLWNTTNIGFPTLEAEGLLILLSEQGLCASAGAACSSGSLEPSSVLLAMGVPETFAHGSLRFSLGRETTADEINRAIEIVIACVRRLQGSSASLAR
jgi:cysteine desulfurase